MPRSLFADLRSRVLAAVGLGIPCQQASAQFEVSAASAIRWAAGRRSGGDIRPRPQGGDRPSRRTEAHARLIQAALDAVPEITLAELEAREAWFEGQLDLGPERVVFLDETATATNMERRYGRAPRGERCRIAVPHGHYKTTTVTAALRASGPFAIHLMDGATNGQRFLSYVTDTFVPALKLGDTVIIDNLAAHKVAGVRQAIEAAGSHLRYLPAYSPDFNPIENAFAKLKALLRTAAARTVPDLWAAIRQAFASFKPDECRNYLAAAGYDAYDPA